MCLNALGCGGSELVTSSTPTCDVYPTHSQTTCAVVNDQVSYSITDDKREQRNARRRATYRKKKDDQVKLQNEKQTVSQPPLGDITNINQPSGSMPGKGVQSYELTAVTNQIWESNIRIRTFSFDLQ